MDRWLARIIEAQGRWAKPFGEFNHRWLHALFRPIPAIRDLLNGRWLGHPLHGVLTDAPIGILFLVIVLDVLDLRTAADVALIVGILTMLAAALAGFADYADTDGTARERATVHSTLMVVALLVYVASLAIRGAGGDDRTAAVRRSRTSRTMTRKRIPIGASVRTPWSGCPSQRPLSRSRIAGIGRKSAFSQRLLKSPNGFAQRPWAAMRRASQRSMVTSRRRA